MWSRGDNTVGVSFVGLDGAVLATLDGTNLYQPGRSPDAVVLTGSGSEFWRLDVAGHRLVPITKAQADQLVSAAPGPRLPIPPNSVGRWDWVGTSPDGSELLGSYEQNGYGNQLSECSEPVAMIQRGSQPPEPVTGQSLANVQPTSALGWTAEDQALVSVATGPCGPGPRDYADGVYLFGPSGGGHQIHMPDGSYYFEAWNIGHAGLG
jgi:hypothetical protein